MKFKIAITSILTAILATCIYTAYKLTSEAKKQTQLQLAQVKELIVIAESTSDTTKMSWIKDVNGNWKPEFFSIEENTENDSYEFIYEANEYHSEVVKTIKNIEETTANP